jgi:4'-phosphopantetheinyl transferase
MPAPLRVEDAPPLRGTELHLWRIPIDAQRAAPLDLLAPDELQRARRFRFARDRNAFVQRRTALRRLLGHYCGGDPSALHFVHNAWGRPSIAGWADAPHFSLSHTAGLALLVITREGPVGVDVERIRPLERLLEVARSFFSAGEVAALEEIAPAARDVAFLRCWTRKEAVVKALGMGLSVPLDSFDVSVGAAARLLTTRAAFPGAGTWRLRDLRLGDGWLGALATGEAGARRWLSAELEVGEY